jgi:hypothetical protein
MGLRQAEMTWIARETLDLYARSKSKLHAIDNWLEQNPMIRENGEVAPVMKVYWHALNSSMRALDALRAVIADLARTDDRYVHALDALEAEVRS